MTMMKNRMSGLILCLLFALATPVAAQVQVTQQRIEFDERVVELTEPVLRGLMTGLDLEFALLTEWAKLLGTYKSPEEYKACERRVAASPEFQKIQMQVLNWPDNPTPEQAQRLSEKMTADMAALLRNRCGGNIEEEWSIEKRREKYQEIHKKAAAAAGLLLGSSSTPPPEPGGPAIDDAPAVGLAQEESTDPMDIAQERVDAYCKYKKIRKEKGDPVVPNDEFPIGLVAAWGFKANVIDPAVSPSINWMFTAKELAAMERDNSCTPIEFKVGRITILLEMPPIYIRGRGPIKTRR